MSTAGRSSGTNTSTGRSPSVERRASTAACANSETEMGLRRTTRAPASIRVMSSRLVTRRVSRSVSMSMRPWSSSVSASESGVGGCEQGRRRHLHGGQRGAKIVRHRPDQGAPQAVHLLEQLRSKRLLSQLRPLERQGGVIGEGSEQGPVRLGGRHAPHGQHADRTARRGERDGPDLIRAAGPRAEADRDAGQRIEPAELVRRERLSRRGGDFQTVGLWDEQRDPGDVEHGPDGADDRLEQFGHRAILDQKLGQFEEPAGIDGPCLGFGAGRLEMGDDPGHQQHHHRVDG